MRSSREHGGERLLGLVDDEHGARQGGGDVLAPAGAQGLEAGPAVVDGERDAEEVAELAVEVAGAALGVLDGADDDVGQGAEPLGEQAQDDALAGAGVAGDHGEAAVGDAELDAAEEGVDGGRDVERLGGDVGAEGVVLQAVERQKFGASYDQSSSSSSAWVVSSLGR